MLALVAALAVSSSFIGIASAHVGAWGPGMYCRNGPQTEDNPNAPTIAQPLWQETWDGFWFHGNCSDYPPPEGEFLELPAGGQVTLELADNRGHTTFSYNGTHTSDWADGQPHPELYNRGPTKECVTSPNMHAFYEGHAAGTVLAIAYNSNISDVKYEDLVIFSVLANSPWKRIGVYDVPADLPACPDDGCTCAWSWVPDHCGEPNMYMNGFKCKVTNARPDAPAVAKAQVPKWCEGNPAGCVSGPKGIVIFNQDPSINNIADLDAMQADGDWRSPNYNLKMGFQPGAQNDIFVTRPSVSTLSPVSTTVSTAPTSSTETPVETTDTSTSSPLSSTETSSTGTPTESQSTSPSTMTSSGRHWHHRPHRHHRYNLWKGIHRSSAGPSRLRR